MKDYPEPVLTPDISNRTDLDRLIVTFYERVFADELIGPFFTQVTRVMPETHVQLHLKQAIEPHHFERWLSLFCQVVDELFRGPLAEQAKIRAQSMAMVLQVKIHRLNTAKL